ncbi:hypothetical protein AB3N02_22115 [Priestia aryabhattai]|uniref:hypothetical protein n=1 Tax=Priestia aryabhattai TaxID=412384 RepID=UPI0039A0E8DF
MVITINVLTLLATLITIGTIVFVATHINRSEVKEWSFALGLGLSVAGILAILA